MRKSVQAILWVLAAGVLMVVTSSDARAQSCTSRDYYHDETGNMTNGSRRSDPHTCRTNCDCTGQRTCSQFGWCQGKANHPPGGNSGGGGNGGGGNGGGGNGGGNGGGDTCTGRDCDSKGQARDRGYDQGRPDGISEGRERGRADGDRAGYNNGRDDGYRDGRDESRRNSYDDGYRDGRAQRDERAYDNGYRDGTRDGETEGARNGDRDGARNGYDDGHRDGFAAGEADGSAADSVRRRYDEGFDAGYETGRRRAETDAEKDYEAARDRRIEEIKASAPGQTVDVDQGLEVRSTDDGGLSLMAAPSYDPYYGEDFRNDRWYDPPSVGSSLTPQAYAPNPPNPDWRYRNYRQPYTKSELKTAYKDGYDEGYRDGMRREYTPAWEHAFQRGWDAGYRETYEREARRHNRNEYNRGYNDGLNQGAEEDYERGRSSGYDRSYQAAYDDAYHRARTAEYDRGYDAGYTKGYDDAREAGENTAFNRGHRDGDARAYDDYIASYKEAAEARGIADAEADMAGAVVLTSATLEDASGNGVFKHGEKAVLHVNVRNFGNQVVRAEVQVQRLSGPIRMDSSSTLLEDLEGDTLGRYTNVLGGAADQYSTGEVGLRVSLVVDGRTVGTVDLNKPTESGKVTNRSLKGFWSGTTKTTKCQDVISSLSIVEDAGLGQVQANCPDGSKAENIGDHSGEARQLACPAGHVVKGFQANSNSYLKDLRLICVPDDDLDGKEVIARTVYTGRSVRYQDKCPRNSAAVGFRVSTQRRVSKIGLVCVSF